MTKVTKPGTSRSYHICVLVDRAIEELKKGNNIFSGTPMEALKDLMAQKKKGKPFYTGCSNEDKQGRCKGHISKDKIMV